MKYIKLCERAFLGLRHGRQKIEFARLEASHSSLSSHVMVKQLNGQKQQQQQQQQHETFCLTGFVWHMAEDKTAS